MSAASTSVFQRYKKLMAVLVAVIALTIAVFSFYVPAYADVQDELDKIIDDGLGDIDFSEVDKLTDGKWIESVVAKIKQILNGEFDDANTFLNFLGDIFLDQFKSVLPSLITLLVLCIMCGLITKNTGGFISQGTGNVIYFATFSVVLLTVITSLYGLYSEVANLLTKISAITDAGMPILLTLMIANGAGVSASVYRPAVAMLSGTVVNVVTRVILPLCLFGLVFSAISHLTDNVKVTKLSSFFNNLGSWLLGLIFMVFSAFISVQGITAASVDGISIRAAKFATKNYIPILGGYLSDGFDMILASSTLIKNAFGVVTLIILMSALLGPLLNILVYNLGLQLVAAVAEPVTDKKFIGFFGAISKNLTFLTVVIIAVAFMFFIMIMLAIYTANGV